MRLPKRPQLLSLGLLALVVGLAIAETIASTYSYRQQIREQDWQMAAELVEQYRLQHQDKADSTRIVLASDWLGPRARMHIPQLATDSAVAQADLRGVSQLLVLADRDDDPWPTWLLDDLEDRNRPELVREHLLGGLRAYDYRFSSTEVIQWDLTDPLQAKKLTISTEEGQCRYSPRAKRWKCPDGRLELRFVEIDYRARRCLAVELEEGSVLHIDLSDIPFPEHTILRGHLGFDNFDARLRSDAAVQLSFTSQEHFLARWTITDDEGWKSMTLEIPKHSDHRDEAHSSLRLDLLVSWPGTFTPKGYRERPKHSPCLEFRGFKRARP